MATSRAGFMEIGLEVSKTLETSHQASWGVTPWLTPIGEQYAVNQSLAIRRSDCDRVCIRAAGLGADPTRLPILPRRASQSGGPRGS